jgi:uncharacterized membrane protein YbhN (UPF0104 family)
MTLAGLVVLLLILASVGSLAVVSLALAHVLAGWGIFFFYTVPALGLLVWAWRESSPSTWRRAVAPFLRARRAVARRERRGRREAERAPRTSGPAGGREAAVSRTRVPEGATGAAQRRATRPATGPLSTRLAAPSVRIPPPAGLTPEPVAALVPETIRPWLRLMRAFLAAWRSPRGRRLVSIGFGLSALAIFALAGRHFASVGWPLHGADLGLVAAAGALFVSTYPFKALGWQRIFRPHERPEALTLAASTGASSVTGVALPGRFDDVVRIAVVRRLSGPHPGVGTIVLSLLLLGLLDAAALMPFASAAASTSTAALGLRIALAVVAAAGLAAAILVAVLTRLTEHERRGRYRLTRWLRRHAPASTRDAAYAAFLVTTAWLVRVVALVVLLVALGFGASFPLAVAFLAAGAASAALPIGPAGAATQAGAGAAVLASAGVDANTAVAFAAVAQALHILAGAVVVLFAAVWHGGRKLRAERSQSGFH